MARTDLTAERLREILNYDQHTGLFIWAKTIGRRACAGRAAGFLKKNDGYTYVGIEGVTYSCHRLAWLYVRGEHPKGEIDHINGIRSDNRIANLRDVSKFVNQQNRWKPKAGTSKKFIGTTFDKKTGKWRAEIRAYLGSFDTEEDAHDEYLRAKSLLHAT